MSKRTCSLPDCDQPHRARGLCRRHYKQAHELHDVVCIECGVEFQSTRATGKLCSNDCRSKHYASSPEIIASNRARRRPRALVHVPNAPAFTWLPTQHPVMRRIKQRKPHVWYSGTCGWCGESFTDWQPMARYCSAKCGRAMVKRGVRQRYGKQLALTMQERLALYARDDWTCQLCMEPVEQDLMTTNPRDDWAPSLDHVTPRSLGGSDDPSNLRLAHRWCNSVRGDGSRWTESDLKACA